MQLQIVSRVYRIRVFLRGSIVEVFSSKLKVFNGCPDYSRVRAYLKRKYCPRRVIPLVDDVDGVIDFVLV